MTAAASDWQRLSPHPQPGSVDDAVNTSAHNIVETVKDTTVKKAPITPDNRGLAYGDGFFSTIAVIDGMMLWQDYHYQRLLSHARALQLALDSQKLMVILQAHAQKLQQGMIKVIVTRVAQPVRGYGFTPDTVGSGCEVWLKSVAMAIATTMTAGLPDGRTLLMQPAVSAACLHAQLACLPPPLAGLKTLNRLDSVLASGELQALKAAEPSIGEGLLRDMSGSWIEGTMSNVFYQLSNSPKPPTNPSHYSVNSSDKLSANNLLSGQLSGQWFMPPLTQSGVAGVLRQVIIDALAATNQPVNIRPLDDKDLPNLTQMFFCNALRGVMPVSSLTLLNGEVVRF